jgi:hypothetical protein
MTSCASCKNKTSNDRCGNPALQGLSLCGKHARVKSPRLWNVVNHVDEKIVSISKFWRGYIVRKRLATAGPGVFQRSLCNNQEELVSLEPISKVDVFNYFGFEEGGKIWGFDVRTILDSLQRNLVPTNPYTRQPLTLENRSRLRKIYSYRLRHKLENSYEHNKIQTAELLLLNRWTQICQIVEENGFFQPNPNLFLNLNKTQLYIFLTMIHNDLKPWAAEHKPPHSQRFRYVFWTNNVLKKHSSTQSLAEYSFFVSTILLSMLYNSVEPYAICFIIMSALYRL